MMCSTCVDRRLCARALAVIVMTYIHTDRHKESVPLEAVIVSLLEAAPAESIEVGEACKAACAKK